MKQVDFIVVGFGLAGLAVCETLRKRHLSFVVFDDAYYHSSKVAGGLYNPVILKRFTPAWMAKEQLQIASKFYKDLEHYLQASFDFKIPIYRVFKSIEEQNNWFSATDNNQLEEFLSTDLIKNSNQCINAPLGFGEVLHCGRIDTERMLQDYKMSMVKEDTFFGERLNYLDLDIDDDQISYKSVVSKKIVFAEGFGSKHNPFFNELPLRGTKGEVLIIYAPDLNLHAVVKASIFLIPLGEDLYYVGATYNHENKDQLPSKEGRDYLIDKLSDLISCNFEVKEHLAGIRPTTKDRRPIVGWHTDYPNLGLINGLGTRGVMIAPYVAEQLINSLSGYAINPEIDMHRFKK